MGLGATLSIRWASLPPWPTEARAPPSAKTAACADATHGVRTCIFPQNGESRVTARAPADGGPSRPQYRHLP